MLANDRYWSSMRSATTARVELRYLNPGQMSTTAERKGCIGSPRGWWSNLSGSIGHLLAQSQTAGEGSGWPLFLLALGPHFRPVVPRTSSSFARALQGFTDLLVTFTKYDASHAWGSQELRQISSTKATTVRVLVHWVRGKDKATAPGHSCIRYCTMDAPCPHQTTVQDYRDVPAGQSLPWPRQLRLTA